VKLDRIERDMYRTFDVVRWFVHRGVRIYALTEFGFDPFQNEPSQKLRLAVYAFLGEWEAHKTSEAAKAALEIKKLKRERVSRFPPAGCRFVERDGRQYVEPDPKQAYLHVLVCVLSERGYPICQIGQWFNELNLHMPDHRRWVRVSKRDPYKRLR
jgi:DNA invertase Pin-like site-specific DNA recombinase